MAKGRKTGGGPRTGRPNKLTASLKEMIETALSDAGGSAYLVARAQDTPGPFLALVGKLLPRDVHLAGSVSVSVVQALEELDRSKS